MKTRGVMRDPNVQGILGVSIQTMAVLRAGSKATVKESL